MTASERTFRTALLAGAALVTLLACAPPQTTSPGLGPRQRWDAWVAEHVVVKRPATLPAGIAGWYDTDTHESVISLAFLAAKEAAWPGMGAFTEIHENAHAFIYDYGLRYGAPTLLIDQERGANCVAQIVTGHPTPQPPIDATGYWICPDWAVARTTQALIAAGAWI